MYDAERRLRLYEHRDRGRRAAQRAARRSDRAELQDMLSDLPAVGTDREHWFRVGKLRAELRAKGLSVSTDAHVAQCAIDTGGALLTEDRVFGKIARLVPLQVA